MAYLTSQLISDAFYISNIVSRQFETPSGQQVNDGLNTLNDLLADKTINSSMIPYTQVLDLVAVPGQTQYFIPNLTGIETFTFFIDELRFQTRNQQRAEFFGSFRQVNINSLPFNWHTERVLGGMNLYLYFVPNTNYPLEIYGEFALASVTLFQDLSLILDRFYINFLKFELAVRLCKEYGFIPSADILEQFKTYAQWINATSNTMDLRSTKISTLTGPSAINYAITNLSGGWVPT